MGRRMLIVAYFVLVSFCVAAFGGELTQDVEISRGEMAELTW